jgi:hypothetical protein
VNESHSQPASGVSLMTPHILARIDSAVKLILHYLVLSASGISRIAKAIAAISACVKAS